MPSSQRLIEKAKPYGSTATTRAPATCTLSLHATGAIVQRNLADAVQKAPPSIPR
jgi:hypothetical protein